MIWTTQHFSAFSGILCLKMRLVSNISLCQLFISITRWKHCWTLQRKTRMLIYHIKVYDRYISVAEGVITCALLEHEMHKISPLVCPSGTSTYWARADNALSNQKRGLAVQGNSGARGWCSFSGQWTGGNKKGVRKWTKSFLGSMAPGCKKHHYIQR